MGLQVDVGDAADAVGAEEAGHWLGVGVRLGLGVGPTTVIETWAGAISRTCNPGGGVTLTTMMWVPGASPETGADALSAQASNASSAASEPPSVTLTWCRGQAVGVVRARTLQRHAGKECL